jgi:hypothetical protein
MKRAPSLIVLLLNLVLVAVTVFSGVVASEWLTRSTDLSWLMADPNGAGRIVVGFLLLVLFSFAGMPLFNLGLAARDFYRGFRWQALVSGGISAALILMLALWIGLGGPFASYKEAQVGRAWAATLDPIDTFTSRYPEGPASDGALRLAAAGARIGIDLIPYGVPGTRPAESDRKSYEAVREKLLAFVSSETDKANAMLDAPPVEVAQWLSAHTTGVTALVGEVLQRRPDRLRDGLVHVRQTACELYGTKRGCLRAHPVRFREGTYGGFESGARRS